MATQVEWNDNTVEIRMYYSPRYGYFAGETDVAVNGQFVARSGGFTFTDSAEGRFADQDGAAHDIEVQTLTGLNSLSNGEVIVRIDGFVVHQGKASVENAWVGIVAGFGLGAVGVLLVLSLLLTK